MSRELSYEKITEKIYFFESTVIVPIGLLLNILQIIVFKSKSFKNLNIGFMMITHVTFDSVALFWNFVVNGYLRTLINSFATFSELICTLFQYISRIIQQLPFYYQSFISFLSFLSVNYPIKFKQFNKKSNHIYSIIIIVISLFLLNIPSAIKYIKIDQINNTNTSSCVSTNLIYQISTIKTAILRLLVPFFLIIIFNLFSIKKLIESRRNLNASLKKEKRFCLVLIILGFVFFLFNFPFFYQTILRLVKNNSTSNYSDFIFNCTRAFSWNYYGVGFIINIFSNRLFRKAFVKIITCKKESQYHFLAKRR
jgi:hypothetical protein